tara:strand:- start:194 stop:439 length:246 start_codon:yes stop_codon:yes gene_type:complete
MKYVYAPSMQLEKGGPIVPAKEGEEGLVSAVEDLVGGIKVLAHDGEIGRYIMKVPKDQSILDGWEKKTKRAVASDYPGLIS